MTTYGSIEEYAEHIRKEMTRIMGASMAGCSQRAGELAAHLCTEAAGIVQGKQMQEESQGEDRYDLTALHVDVSVLSTSENPFEDE